MNISFVFSCFILQLKKNSFLQAELNKVVAENGEVESEAQSDGKKSKEKTTSDNSKHHSLLLQVNILRVGEGVYRGRGSFIFWLGS